MSMINTTKHINASPERVFALMTDLDAYAKNIPAIKRIEPLTPGPVGKGTRFRETRIMFGKEATETLEFIEFNPVSGYTIGSTSCGVVYQCRFTMQPSKGGTELGMTIDCRPVTFMARIMSPIMGVLMRGAMRKALDGDLESIKKAAESI